MKAFYIPFALAVGGILLYHISQKSIPRSIDPLYTIMIAYVFGIVVCFLSTFIYSNDKSLPSVLKQSNWAVFTLGVAVAAVELGFMLAYRAGWNISWAAAASSVAVTVLLVPIGLLFYGE